MRKCIKLSVLTIGLVLVISAIALESHAMNTTVSFVTPSSSSSQSGTPYVAVMGQDGLWHQVQDVKSISVFQNTFSVSVTDSAGNRYQYQCELQTSRGAANLTNGQALVSLNGLAHANGAAVVQSDDPGNEVGLNSATCKNQA